MIAKVPVPASAYETYRAERLELAARLRRGDFTPLPHDHVLARRIALAFEQGVARLEPYPNADPRWAQRFAGPLNRGEYEWPIHDLLEQRLQICPNDDEIRWLLIGFGVYFGDNDFEAKLFGPLIVRDPMNLRWLIASAVWVKALSGVDTAPYLREELLLLNDVVPNIAKHIEQLQNTDDAHARWVGALGMAAYEQGTYGQQSLTPQFSVVR